MSNEKVIDGRRLDDLLKFECDNSMDLAGFIETDSMNKKKAVKIKC